MRTVALLVATPDAGQFGHARSLSNRIGDHTVLEHTLRRAAAVAAVDAIGIVAYPGNIPDVPAECAGKPIHTIRIDKPADEDVVRRRRVRRAWSMHAWRGGFRGATVWDELAPWAPLAQAAMQLEADAVLLAGADWCVLDPSLCDALLGRHAENPEAMPLCFSQAPPGLSGLVLSAKLLGDLAAGHGSISDLLAYAPARPAVDPISQDFNVAVPADVRAAGQRFIADTPEARRHLRDLHEHLGPQRFSDANASDLAAASLAVRSHGVPDILEVELTPRRALSGPVTPQHDAELLRPDLSASLQAQLAAEATGRVVTLGGIGESRLHPGWPDAVAAFREAGAAAVALRTDLLAVADETPADVAGSILAADPDVVFVRLQAETAETYAEVTGADRFAFVLEAVQALFDGRAAAARARGHRHPFPLIVPIFTKIQGNTPEMDRFFERWWQLADHLVIERFPQGGRGPLALAKDRNPVPMDPPWTAPDERQRMHRLTILSDGTVCLCHEDWLGRASLGNLAASSLVDLWSQFELPDAASDWQHDRSPMCPRCFGFASLRHHALSHA